MLVKPFYSAYTRLLELERRHWRIPKHIGIVMDGNRRFAKMIGHKNVIAGHRAGADKLDEVLGWCEEVGVEVVSVWGFSLDNFKREEAEVKDLMGLFEQKFLDLVTDKRIHRDQVRVHSFGRVNLLPRNVQKAIREAEKATAHYERRVLNVGIAYGGREEIVDAFKRYLKAAQKKKLSLEQIARDLEADHITPYMYTAHVPDPDLIIRTSGEVRLSGFMLWQAAYSEYYFCDTNWPAFRKIDFLRALRAFDQRNRRFGK